MANITYTISSTTDGMPNWSGTIYGVDIERLNNFFNSEIFDDNILKKLVDQGFIAINKQKIAIAKNYWIFANSVIEKVVSALKK